MRNLWLSNHQLEELPVREQFICDICHQPAVVTDNKFHYCKPCSYKNIDFRQVKYWDKYSPLYSEKSFT